MPRSARAGATPARTERGTPRGRGDRRRGAATPREASATPASTRGGTAIRALRLAAAWALGLLLLASTGSALGVALYPTVTGGQALAVLSGSMTPGLPVGGMVFTRVVDPAEVGIGDVITFQHPSDPSARVTHRVVAIDDGGGAPLFTTKGDANEDPDSTPVPASAVQGRLWFAVPEIGRLLSVLQSPRGVGVLVVLVCGLIAVHPGKRDDEGEPPDPKDVDADSARTVVMAPVTDQPLPPGEPRTPAQPLPPDEPRTPDQPLPPGEPRTLLVAAARPAVPVPPPPARLLH